MKLNPKQAYRMSPKPYTNESKAAAEQRQFKSFCRQLESMLIANGCTKEEVELFFAAGNDPEKMAFAVAAIQIGREDREREAALSGDVF